MNKGMNEERASDHAINMVMKYSVEQVSRRCYHGAHGVHCARSHHVKVIFES